ncbi:MAG: beta-galactosidase [Treponema sp.]|nr:beta-galactosidase [Treponema sp.]
MEIKKAEVSFGAAYYPEEWDEEHWEADAALMQKMGLAVVRMGEYAWPKIETSEGQFNFTWLDEVIEIFAKHRIKTVLGIPTSVVPRWLIEKYPDILATNRSGLTFDYGAKNPVCYSIADYIDKCVILASTIAEHYKENPNVVGYQVDDEIGENYDDFCYCPACTHAFGRWLEKKYNSVERLNNSWGPMTYCQSFKQIKPPRNIATNRNPSQILDWKRFRSDLMVSFIGKLTNAVKAQNGNKFVTSNIAIENGVNIYDIATKLDFVSYNNFPDTIKNSAINREKPVQTAAKQEFMRGAKNSSVWVMEQQCGAAGSSSLSRAVLPGQMRLWTTQAVAHGADTIIFARWRPHIYDTDEYCEGILPLYGDTSRVYEELQRTVMMLKPAMNDIRNVNTSSTCNIIYSQEESWALNLQKIHEDFSYETAITEYYNAFYERNIPVDFISTDRDFKYSKLVVAPYLYMLDRGLQARLDTFVMAGGTVIFTMRSGVKNNDNTCRTDGPQPCGLDAMAGVAVTGSDCLCDSPVSVRWVAPLPSVKTSVNTPTGIVRKLEPMPLPPASRMYGRYWADIIKTYEETEVLAEFGGDGFYSGKPAVTVHKHGSGRAYFISTDPSPSLLRLVIAHAVNAVGLSKSPKSPTGVEIVRRSGKENDWLFIINHNKVACKVETPPMSLGPYGVRVLAVAKPRAPITVN